MCLSDTQLYVIYHSNAVAQASPEAFCRAPSLQAQPTTYSHCLMAFSERLHDPFEQLTPVYRRIDRSLLGAAGLPGTTLSIDRNLTTSMLGFSNVLDNLRLGCDSYYQVELITTLTMAMTLLSDL